MSRASPISFFSPHSGRSYRQGGDEARLKLGEAGGRQGVGSEVGLKVKRGLGFM